MFIKQLSIFIENKQGRLSEITELLYEKGIDIRALSIADTTNYGILRLIVNKPQEALAELKNEGITVSLTDVIAIAIPDRPGSLFTAIKLLSDAQVTIEYMYASLNPRKEMAAFIIMRVDDKDKAIDTFKESHIELMTFNSIA